MVGCARTDTPRVMSRRPAAGPTIIVEVKVARSPVTCFCKYHRSSGMVGALLPST
jgi:hypothetical protein